MKISRRTLFRGALAAGAAGAATAVAGRAAATEHHASAGHEARKASPDAVGMLYDSTRCENCGACTASCKEANGLVKKEVQKSTVGEVDCGGSAAKVKRQCMHCIDPSCVSACMLGALHKEGEGKRDAGGERKGTGVVLYDPGLCLGCRYCQIACAFNVPRFEWKETFPRIVKCELCRHRRDATKEGPLAVANPACCEVCPAEAVVYGKRSELLAEAKRRIAAEPGRYAPRVYGETDGGGTQVLYLAPAGVTFAQLGLPVLPERSNASFSEGISHAPFLHGLTPVALYAAAAFVIRRNKKSEAKPPPSERSDS